MDRLTWSAIQSVHDSDAGVHWAQARALGLDCPTDVFGQLYFDHHDDAELARRCRSVAWRSVSWNEEAFSGVALRQVGVPRPFEQAVGEARRCTLAQGFSDERPEVMAHWQSLHTWMQPPVIVAGYVLPSGLRYELLVGFTRLGNLLGALDRQELPEFARHRVWIGRLR
jgi:hypothetical protein